MDYNDWRGFNKITGIHKDTKTLRDDNGFDRYGTHKDTGTIYNKNGETRDGIKNKNVNIINQANSYNNTLINKKNTNILNIISDFFKKSGFIINNMNNTNSKDIRLEIKIGQNPLSVMKPINFKSLILLADVNNEEIINSLNIFFSSNYNIQRYKDVEVFIFYSSNNNFLYFMSFLKLLKLFKSESLTEKNVFNSSNNLFKQYFLEKSKFSSDNYCNFIGLTLDESNRLISNLEGFSSEFKDKIININLLHRKYLLGNNIPDYGIKIGCNDYKSVNQCRNCNTKFDLFHNEPLMCYKCHRIICTACGACFCGHPELTERRKKRLNKKGYYG